MIALHQQLKVCSILEEKEKIRRDYWYNHVIGNCYGGNVQIRGF